MYKPFLVQELYKTKPQVKSGLELQFANPFHRRADEWEQN